MEKNIPGLDRLYYIHLSRLRVSRMSVDEAKQRLTYWSSKYLESVLDGDNLDDWARLIERHPDRFMIGTDKVGHWKTYPNEVVKYYSLLDKLKPKTVDMICRENIMSLLKFY